ncbi:MAG: hypothetical protein QOI41_5526, partial [Myxococcales bacterium]|nr:hypothetical protein [Myxococcales bacterium]
MTERAWVVVAVIALGACRSGTSPAPAGPALSAESATAEASASASASADASAEAEAEAKAEVDAGSDGGAPDGMLLVAGGTFTMGSEGGGEGDEHPAHPVTVAAFWLDRTEVTQHAYDECVVAKACPPPDAAILATFQGL